MVEVGGLGTVDIPLIGEERRKATTLAGTVWRGGGLMPSICSLNIASCPQR